MRKKRSLATLNMSVMLTISYLTLACTCEPSSHLMSLLLAFVELGPTTNLVCYFASLDACVDQVGLSPNFASVLLFRKSRMGTGASPISQGKSCQDLVAYPWV